jgi:hypothetical protein
VTQFRSQKTKLIDTLRHLDAVTKGRDLSYSLIVFHKLPVSLVGLNTPFSRIVDKVIEQIESLNPRYHLGSSPAKALSMAAEQISLAGRKDASTLIFLTGSGRSTDLLTETLDVT